MTPLSEQLLAQVKKSPAAVAIHDKAAWMDIFAQYHVVEDPVGSSPHIGGIFDATAGTRGHGALGRFFDTFIAPNEIVFDVRQDMVCGNHVLRDLTINLKMSPKVSATVPMHLLYELVQEGEQWKIVRLAAYWELIPMVTQLLAKGFASMGVLSALTLRMLKYQGFGGMLGFAKAAINIGSHGKQALGAVVQALNDRNTQALLQQFDHSGACVFAPVGEAATTPAAFVDAFQGQLAIEKVMAAGDAVTASFKLTQDGQNTAGVLIAEFNRRSKKISQLRFYFD